MYLFIKFGRVMFIVGKISMKSFMIFGEICFSLFGGNEENYSKKSKSRKNNKKK